jgi:hypothetical protein
MTTRTGKFFVVRDFPAPVLDDGLDYQPTPDGNEGEEEETAEIPQPIPPDTGKLLGPAEEEDGNDVQNEAPFKDLPPKK